MHQLSGGRLAGRHGELAGIVEHPVNELGELVGRMGTRLHQDRVIEALAEGVLERRLANGSVSRVSRRMVESKLELASAEQALHGGQVAPIGALEHHDDFVKPGVDRLGDSLEGLPDRVRVHAVEQEESKARCRVSELESALAQGIASGVRASVLEVDRLQC